MHPDQPISANGHDRSHDGDLVEVSIALGVEARCIARRFVAEQLADRVTASDERWGVVRAADGPTRVCAQLPCAAADG